MEQKYKKWLTYWKKSLSDSLKVDLDIEKLRHFEIENFKMETQNISELEKVNRLIEIEESRINKKRGITYKKSEHWLRINEIEIFISPIKIKPLPENLVYLKDKEPKFPFWFSARIDRKGKLKAPEEIFPLFQRKYLEPLADEKTEFIFAMAENIDKAATIGKETYEDYLDYINYVKNVFNKAVNQEIESYKYKGYETIENGIILLPNEEINAGVSIIKLYEKILKKKSLPELLKTFITLDNRKPNPPLAVSDFINVNPLHLGQMGDEFPLSISQRKSLYTYLQSNDKVFAVNGPPGTGKTTLLQSIVANKFVESAIKGDKAPIILACSTNNQAVTNIIDSFLKSNTKEGKLMGRWLPKVSGYATYLPASGKLEAALKGINYKKLDGGGLFDKVENSLYLNKAKEFFIEQCSNYLGIQVSNIADGIKRLQKEIVEVQSIFKEAPLIWNQYLNAEKLFFTDYANKELKVKRYYFKNFLNEDAFSIDISKLKILEDKIISYFKNEPLFRKLFCFFGFKSSLKTRASEIRILLRDSLIKETNGFVFMQYAILEKIDSKIKTAKNILEAIVKWKEWKIDNSIIGNPHRTKKEYRDFEQLKIKNNSEPNCFYEELDVSLRHKAFQLATHFWEGKYLLKLEADLQVDNCDPQKQGEDTVKNRWQRQAMLTPCFVGTFYMAPRFFSSFKFLQTGEDGRNIFDNPPLFDFIDLLIVDEAGQVSPEIGVATFSLAKQAIVVGDVKQIEPVWNITNKIDIGNLRKRELIKDYKDLIYEKSFDPKGFLASTGSIMQMAQNASNFKENGIIEKGLLLVEHRRCFNEIINYCNVLAYNKQLIPLRGKAPKNLLFPPMYCIHVQGNSTVSNTSRYNLNEVKAIAAWLLNNKKAIETKYGKLEDAVGIITPFVGQKNSLIYALKKAGFDVYILKLGTVHALQGAERPIILFSAVYGKGDSGVMFFDRDNKPNMLNVAVSRAKDNFIIFANTEILDKNASTPSGILAKHLTYK
ncbi:MAG: hypothetical protein JRJ44_03835 [Deltaproteobacteria bacterium]|nr:hypothetical protein [Deltaproteobacteria bacterium]